MKIYLIVMLSLLILSCENKRREVKSSEKGDIKSDSSSVADELVLVKPDNVSMSFTLDNSYTDSIVGKLDKNSSRLTCTITNNNLETVYLVGYTCTDLPGALTITPSTFDTWQFIYCNMSWPIIHKIEAKKSMSFSTFLKSGEENVKIKNLNMYVKFVDKFVDLKTLKEKPELIKTVIDKSYEECSLLVAEESSKRKH